MARLTWQNVAAPDLTSSAATYMQAGRAFNNAFANFGDIARSLQQRQIDNASNAELAMLAQVGSADQVDAYLQNMGSRIAPNQMNDNLIRAVGGLRQGALGYDSTRINQANTKSVMDQRTEDAQYKRDLTKQSAALNVDLSEAYRLQEAGKYQEADALIAKTLRENPIAASQTDVGGVTQNLRTIQSAPNASQFTEEGQKYQQNRNAIIDGAIGTGFDEQSVRTNAFNEARNRGLTISQATSLADEAVKVWAGTGTGGAGDTPIPVAPTGAAGVDASVGTVLGSPQNIPPAAETLAPVTAPQTIGGVPNSQAGVTGADAVDQYLNPTAPVLPASVPTPAATTVEATPTTVDRTDPAQIRRALDTDPNGTITDIRTNQRELDVALDAQGVDAGQRAYQLFSAPDAEGVTLQEDNLFRNVPDDQKKDAQGKLQSAIIKVARDAKVSDKAAKAAVLSTLDPTNWYGGLSTPNVDVSAATNVARQLVNPEMMDAFAGRSQQLSDYRTQQATINAAIDRDVAALTRLQNNPNGMTEAARQKGIETLKDRISKNAAQASKNVDAARKAANLERPTRRNTGEAAIRDEATVPTTARASTSAAPTEPTVEEVNAPAIDSLVPELRKAGLTGTQISENIDGINAEIDRVLSSKRNEVSTAQENQGTLDLINTAVDDIIGNYTSSVSPQVLQTMTPTEIENNAMRYSSSQSVEANNGYWRNVKASLPDDPEFEEFKDMSPQELKREHKRLIPLLQKRVNDTGEVDKTIDTDALIDRIVEKYKNK